MTISPLPANARGSGVLLHVTSLPSRFGIGDFGPVAFRWIDLLSDMGQSWWQVLPLGPTGHGDCPYQSSSTFAGNPLLISLDRLVSENLLTKGDLEQVPKFPTFVDYPQVRLFKGSLIDQAWTTFQRIQPPELMKSFRQFCVDEQDWLNDYALFECLRADFRSGRFWAWPSDIARREPDALKRAREKYREGISKCCFEQFIVFEQMTQMKLYARASGITLVGDLPIFVSPESADVWTNPDFFQLDHRLQPKFVAGVPPDYFSVHGQLWGNPVYDWDNLRQSGYEWWLRRIRGLLKYVDIVRLDHFRGFSASWHVKAGEKSAATGEWVPGPAADFFETLRSQLGGLPFLAEDLGDISEDVIRLRDQFMLTGLRVLQFAFDGNPDSDFLPQKYIHNTVAYTGTHDNNTTRGWYTALGRPQRQLVCDSLHCGWKTPSQIATEFVRQIWHSEAGMAMAPLQDLLNLGAEHRMNVPGKAEGNWAWRCEAEILNSTQIKWLTRLTKDSARGTIGSSQSE